MCSSGFGAKKTAQSEISQLHYSSSCYKHVGWFYVWKTEEKGGGGEVKFTKIANQFPVCNLIPISQGIFLLLFKSRNISRYVLHARHKSKFRLKHHSCIEYALED